MLLYLLICLTCDSEYDSANKHLEKKTKKTLIFLSGRLMSRAEVLGDAEQELKEKGAVNDRGHDFSSKKRKRDTDSSDSVIELVQTDKNDILENEESLPKTVDNENKSTL